jgi:hypothetical protein
MKRSNYIIAALGLCVLTSIWAQAKLPAGEQKQGTAPKHKNYVPVFLGNSQISGVSVVDKAMFDSLVKQGLKSDSGRVVTGFKFSYAERNTYEDSVGNLITVADFNSEYCLGDTLSAGIKASLPYRTKPGDTAYFDAIDVKLPGGGIVEGRPMKIVIKR